MESMSSNRLLTESGGPRSVRDPASSCTGGWGGQFGMTVVVERPEQTSWAIAARGFPSMPGV